MLPAKRDDNPANWEWVGTVTIVTNDGEPLRVELYSTSKNPGAFAAGKTYRERIYFRGGKTAELIEAVNAAYEKSKS